MCLSKVIFCRSVCPTSCSWSFPAYFWPVDIRSNIDTTSSWYLDAISMIPGMCESFWIWVYSLQSRPKLDFSSWETLHMATDVMAATTRMFFKWVNPGLFLIYFRLFKPTLQILKQQKRYEKKCPPSIRCWDSNSQPLEHEFSSLNH